MFGVLCCAHPSPPLLSIKLSGRRASFPFWDTVTKICGDDMGFFSAKLVWTPKGWREEMNEKKEKKEKGISGFLCYFDRLICESCLGDAQPGEWIVATDSPKGFPYNNDHVLFFFFFCNIRAGALIEPRPGMLSSPSASRAQQGAESKYLRTCPDRHSIAPKYTVVWLDRRGVNRDVQHRRHDVFLLLASVFKPSSAF